MPAPPPRPRVRRPARRSGPRGSPRPAPRRGCRRPPRLPAGHDRHAVAQLLDQGHDVAGDHHRPTGRGEAAQDPREHPRGHRVDRLVRLVEHQHRGACAAGRSPGRSSCASPSSTRRRVCPAARPPPARASAAAPRRGPPPRPSACRGNAPSTSATHRPVSRSGNASPSGSTPRRRLASTGSDQTSIALHEGLAGRWAAAGRRPSTVPSSCPRRSARPPRRRTRAALRGRGRRPRPCRRRPDAGPRARASQVRRCCRVCPSCPQPRPAGRRRRSADRPDSDGRSAMMPRSRPGQAVTDYVSSEP